MHALTIPLWQRWNGRWFLGVAGVLALAGVLLVNSSRSDAVVGRFGPPLRVRDLAALAPGARLDRLLVELERQQAQHRPLPPAAGPLAVIGRLEGTLDRSGLGAREATRAAELRRLAEAYTAIGLRPWAEILEQAAAGGDTAAVTRRWATTWSADASRQARLTYLDAHLPEILP